MERKRNQSHPLRFQKPGLHGKRGGGLLSSRTRFELEDPDGAVPTVRGEESAVGADGDGARETFDAGEGLQKSGVLVAPEFDAVIDGSGGEKRLCRMKTQRADRLIVGAKAMFHSERVGIENRDEVVAPGNGDEAAVG